jgi:hypothetical protein
MARLESIEGPLSEWIEREMRATENQRVEAVKNLFLSLSYDNQREIWMWLSAHINETEDGK